MLCQYVDGIHQQLEIMNDCIYKHSTYPINSEWENQHCQTCKCLNNGIIACQNRTCRLQECQKSEQLTIDGLECCPKCLPLKQTCIYQGILIHDLEFVQGECCPNEYLVHRKNSCCLECVRHTCSFYGEIYFDNDIWHTSACQYCSCRMGNIQCKSVQCQYQFCLENEIEERRHDNCCVNCRTPKICYYQEQLVKEGMYIQTDNCTLCTCSSHSQIECYEKCNNKTVITRLLANRNRRIQIDLTLFHFQDNIIHHPKFGVLKSSSTNSTQMNFEDFHAGYIQYLPTVSANNTDIVLLAIIANKHVYTALILINFHSHSIPRIVKMILNSAIGFSGALASNDKSMNNTHLSIRQFTSEQLNSGLVWYTPNKNMLKFKCPSNVAEEECSNYDRMTFDHGVFKIIAGQMVLLNANKLNLTDVNTSEYLDVRHSKGNKDRTRVYFAHRDEPGIKIHTFTKGDLIKGNILVGTNIDDLVEIESPAVTYNFDLVVRNKTIPFKVKILTADLQPPQFREDTSTINVMQLGMTPLLPSLFDVNDPDTSTFELSFILTKQPSAGYMQNSIGTIFKTNDHFQYFELINYTLYYFHTNVNQTNDTISFNVSDGLYSAIKTIIFNVIPLTSTTILTRLNESSLELSINEATQSVIQRQHISYSSLTLDEIKYNLVQLPRYGYFIKNNKQLLLSDTFTQTDIDMYIIRYQAPAEIGLFPISESIIFNVSDIQCSMMLIQMLLINIKPIDNRAPKLSLNTDTIEVIEGEYIYLDENVISLFDIDSSLEQIQVIVETFPIFGYIELTNKRQTVKSFTIVEMLNRFIRYVQNDHHNKEPKRDKFKIYATDGSNDSPLLTVIVNIKSKLNLVNIEDSILMSVFDGNFTSETKNLRILIDNGIRYVYLKNKGLSMANGEKVTINKWMLNLTNDFIPTDSIIYRVTKTSNFGRLIVNTSMTDHFTQTDLNQEQVIFEHLFYETIGVTWFKFDIWIKNQVQLKNQKFIIFIPPTMTQNQIFSLVANNRRTIEKFDLNINDDDTPIESIELSVLISSDYGRLEFKDVP
ncbi:unnamed protein product, partial [Didymodactylos carnosus]